MKLTPLDIRKQEFKTSWRGFDPEEVEAFLVMLADEMEIMIREKNQASDELIKLRTQLRDYQQVEQTLRDTLVKASSTVEESRLNSLHEAELRIQDAEIQAQKIMENAREELSELKHEVSLLKTQKESFIRRFRHLLESQVELLQILGMEDYELSATAKEENQASLRGRLPRPVIVDDMPKQAPVPRPMEQPAVQFAPKPAESAPVPAAPSPGEEPKIIRGDAKFGIAFPGRRADQPDRQHPAEPDNKDAKNNNSRISDQIVI